ncbi:G-protein coupled receptor 157-like isoform X2 [Lineus longissimus]|uniref:G-protein coupled receptor 157-like isoform X2 n=1 Tax=Lineus longissimus TaxID=88925 RepID=UPI00315CEAEB
MFWPHPTTDAMSSTTAETFTTAISYNITAALIITNGTETNIVLYSAAQPAFLAVTIISCLAALLGSSLVVISYACYPETRSTSRLLVVFISAADFLIALGNLIGVLRYLYNYFHRVSHQCDPTPAVCLMQAIMTSTGGMWSFFWTFFTAVYLYVMVVKGRTYWVDKAIPAAHVIAWGIPVVMVAIAWGQGALGEDLSEVSAGWCWVKTCSGAPKAEQVAWMLFTGKLWEIVAWFVSMALYIAITCHVRKLGFGDSSVGFFNSVIYCLSTAFIRRKMCCCCRKDEHLRPDTNETNTVRFQKF